MPSVDRAANPRRRKKWSDEEDMRLLEAMEHFGFGNWEDVSKRIGTKSPEDARERYVSCYLHGPIGQATWSGVQSESQLVDCHPLDVVQPSDASSEQLTEEQLIQLGYMPNSDDYMCQYDHGAEKIISNLTVNKDDDDLDLALKMAMLCVYNRRIAERLRRKKVAREYSLQANFFRQDQDTQDPEEIERGQFADRLRIFSQLMPASEHSALVSNLWGERSARRRLDDLYKYRRHGVTRFDECEHFEQHYALRQASGKRGAHRRLRPLRPRRGDRPSDSIYVFG